MTNNLASIEGVKILTKEPPNNGKLIIQTSKLVDSYGLTTDTRFNILLKTEGGCFFECKNKTIMVNFSCFVISFSVRNLKKMLSSFIIAKIYLAKTAKKTL
ncbi:MAG: hypothetical protein AB2693_35030 [Candidatus Thiodiazotropha sp.]